MSERAKFGAELRRLRAASGLSLADLEKRVHYSKGFLSKVETGLATPSAALAALCEEQLDAPGALTALLPGRPARRRTRPDTRPSGLPPATNTFVGRQAELSRVRQALSSEGGVCVISGLGGIGKTELAVRCAHRLEAGFADGCLYVDLRVSDEPSVVQDRLLRMLGEPPESIPADPDDRTAYYRNRLGGRSFLLVFDNAGSAAQVRPLLPAEPKSRVLITSRSRLAALDEAAHVSLDVLSEPAASELFASLTGVEPDEAVAGIVTRCGLLPLAIRIAAARLRSHPAWDAAELERRLARAQVRIAELDDGERSVSAAFDLSVQQLPHAESRLLGLLTLLPGADFDLDTAGVLGGRGTERVLDRLHDVHLLTQPAIDRYAFHDLVRSHAGGHLFATTSAAQQATMFRHVMDFAVRSAEAADRLITPGRYRPELAWPDDTPAKELETDDDAVNWLSAEWPNLVALCQSAGERGEFDRCWRLAYSLRGFFFLAKLWEPWIETHEWAQSAARASGDRWALATSTANLGVALADRGDPDAASVRYEQALSLYREIGDGHGESTALAHQAWADHYRGRHEEALQNLRRAAAFYEQEGNERNAAITNRGISLVLTSLGSAAEAAELAASTLPVFEELVLNLDAVMALNCMGWAYFHSGDYERATAAYDEATARAERCSSTYEAARAFTGLGNIARARGDKVEATIWWARADEIHPALPPASVGEARVRAT
ncbi:tetratricopeptide repeat protein [Amycolatopsis acidicola]|uniref:Tetratricopeptide repeat protein n=1 Tax=Amycolatopsis acidicola TaxID=2596893 RepID=A0A5N0VAP7_9PSEU|nr:XRE family transcriptional regulator [Amycolatopsis acidicola]KAA9161632.1 tetratricopeptide repeat protein [Amycolatopsis acidicola]